MASYDVAIIGGGPAGSTAATLLKKYNPDLKVVVFEREKFPREHVGESQLPLIGSILNEMGCWEKIEHAGFPIKIGATYRWGATTDLWDFEFIPTKEFCHLERPARYEGQRQRTAFQVDRAIYDKILLDHAAEHGVEVHEETRVSEIQHEGDKVTGLKLGDGTEVKARYYIDASGAAGAMRRALEISTSEPSNLRNIAFWDYWENADWAVEIGVGGTRVQVMSQSFGWLWFIPLGPTRTSIGLILPADYYKKSGKSVEELYIQAIENDPRISALCKNATREGEVRSMKDWSFMADRMVGENWFLIGESAGFADPILAAGMTLAHVGAKDAAYTILELDRGELGKKWLREEFEDRQKRRLLRHIRFADFWYTANGQFTDLVEFTREIAKDAGFDMTAEKSWQWLGTGGFVDEELGGGGIGAYSLGAAKFLVNQFGEGRSEWNLSKNNVLRLNLYGAKERPFAYYANGRIHRINCYERDGKLLPMDSAFRFFVELLQKTERIDEIRTALWTDYAQRPGDKTPQLNFGLGLQALEAMILDGWVEAKYYKKLPLIDFGLEQDPENMHPNRDAPIAS